MSEIVILDSDRGKTVEAHVGDLITVQLAENPTTGYRWQLISVDSHLVDFQSSDYAPSSEIGTGSGGLRRFHFQAKLIGMNTIQLERQRLWEAQPSTTEQFTVTLQIQ